MIRRILFALALLCMQPACAHARPVVWGGTPCTADGVDSDQCYNGGSVQVPTFFRGYAQLSVGVTIPAGSNEFTAWTQAVSLQPSVYPVRPPWNVAGVDYAVGMPRWQMPTLSNLSGQPWLKDPAQIANDPLANPDGPGADCRFYLTNTAAGGVEPGTSASPGPFPNGGPGIQCKRTGGSTHQIIFDGYNLAWNSTTGYGCVPVAFSGNSYGTAAAQNSKETAAIIFRNSLFVNGPNCSIWGEIDGTNVGPNNGAIATMITINSAVGAVNSFAFYNNTLYGCGGDTLATALETALCSASFNATSYNSGAVTGMITGATIGVAPVKSDVVKEGGASSMWVVNNAFLHMSARFGGGTQNATPNSFTMVGNYIEGEEYLGGFLYAFHAVSIANAGGTTETITTLSPHGLPVGSYFAYNFGSSGASGFPAGWAGLRSMKSTGAYTLQFNSATNYGDWTYAGSGAYPLATPNFEHGEFVEFGYNTAGAVFNATISGTALTVNTLTSGTLAIGQYVTAQSGSGCSLPSPTYIVSGTAPNWVLNQAPGNMTCNMVSPYYTVGAPLGGPITLNVSYNTVLDTPSAIGANEGLFYVSTGSGTAGIPLLQFTGSIDHNVFVPNLTTSGPATRNTSNIIALAYDQAQNLSITKNYLDPTGAFFCYNQFSGWDASSITLANNVNLLSPTDPYINQQDGYAILPYSAGTNSNSQAQNGIIYNSATGVVTVTLSNSTLPPGFGVGSVFSLGGGTVTTGTNYLNGNHFVTGTSGNTFTFQAGTGYPGTPNSAAAGIVLAVGSSLAVAQYQTCYGHN